MTASDFQRNRKFADTPFGRIAYSDIGRGPAAVFMHGFPLNGYQWREVAAMVQDRRRCILPDMMGLGYSEVAADRDLSFNQQAKTIAALLDTLKIDAADFVGNDTGGGVSQIFAAQNPSRVRSLTLTNCEVHDLWPNEMLRNIEDGLASGALDQGFKAMAGDPLIARMQLANVFEKPADISDEAFRFYLSPLVANETRLMQVRPFGDWKKNREQLIAAAPGLKSLRAPVQVIWGDNDTAFDMAASLEWLQANLPSLRKLTKVPGAKLFFPEERPKLVSDVLREFWE